ncbi:MAG: long-chain-fatty-acid--CoA ligase [Pseudomonadota bacterium]|nr:long-chain-fatty-acid--CoA ligase [Pseudomonadota bacterium]
MVACGDANCPSVADLVRRWGRERPARRALRFEGRDTSYAELDRQTNQVAAALFAEGIRAGDRIAYYGKNSDYYFTLFYGAAKLGAVTVPVSWRLTAPELIYIVNDIGSQLLFVGDEQRATAQQAAAEMPKVRRLIPMEHAAGGAGFAEWLGHYSDADLLLPASPDCVLLQLYTSGTTGRPKGAMLTSRNLYGLIEHCRANGVEWERWQKDDIALVAMPVGHIGGSGFGARTLYDGATAFIAREFDPGAVLGFIERERISKLFLVPAAIRIMLQDPHAATVDYSRIVHLIYGGSPIQLPLLRAAKAVMGVKFVQHYGMTETAGTFVALEEHDHDTAGTPRMHSAGKALPGVELRVVDPQGRVVAAGVVGEIITRSVKAMTGYWNLPQETAQTIDNQGWLRTGDAGHLDADGYLFLQDRIKDMIVSGGENVYPAEVEAVFASHAAVDEVAVIGVPDDRWGEAVKAVIVGKSGVEIAVDDLLGYARTRLAGFKVPKSIDFVTALPRNANGKVLKRILREPYWAGKERNIH